MSKTIRGTYEYTVFNRIHLVSDVLGYVIVEFTLSFSLASVVVGVMKPVRITLVSAVDTIEVSQVSMTGGLDDIFGTFSTDHWANII